MRLLVLWCPDWPVSAARAALGIPGHLPAAVFAANRVVACSAVARASGLRRGMLRRQAQSRCPELAILDCDEARDARHFEPVAAAVEELVPGVDVVRPGLLALRAPGAAAYFGGSPAARADGEHELAATLTEHVAAATGVECQVGIACGLFAAQLAARRSQVLARGTEAAFLAPLPIGELAQPGTERGELVDLLRRLGVRTLGQFAELPERAVASRFGQHGVHAHRLAAGGGQVPFAPRAPAEELGVVQDCDPPLERVDTAAFVSRTLAERLHAGLTARDLACTRLGIYARTETGEEFSRVWRSAEPVSASGIADRVRWQCEGWLHAAPGARPRSGIARLRLEPEELVQGPALQLALWHEPGGGPGGSNDPSAERAGRALVRVQALLGPEKAGIPVLGAGRGPAERVRLVPWGDRPEPDGREGPWPGRLPAPSPTRVFRDPPPATVRDAGGAPVTLSPRGRLSNPPHSLRIGAPETGGSGVGAPGASGSGAGVPDGQAEVVDDPTADHTAAGDPTGGPAAGTHTAEVRDWAGPWPLDERWWDPAAPAPGARMQVLTAAGTAYLLVCRPRSASPWRVEGVYD